VIELIEMPYGLSDIIKTYGNPDENGDHVLDPEWHSAETEIFQLPFPMRLAWDKNKEVYRIRAHKLVGAVIVDALQEIRDYRGYHYLVENTLDILGGVYNFRFQHGTDYLSTHAWGIAIDINTHLGEMGVKPTMPAFIVEAFKKRGFEWGGDWPGMNPKWPYDGMHFQACEGY